MNGRYPMRDDKVDDQLVTEIKLRCVNEGRCVNVGEINLGGPKSYVDEISYAQVEVDTSRYIDKDQKQLSISYIYFYNENGQLVKSPYLIYNSSTITVREKAQTDGISNTSNDSNLS